MIVGKHSAIKGFSLLVILFILQIPCWNAFANSEYWIVRATGVISIFITATVVFLAYKYEKQILKFFQNPKS
jgi:uncharacterized membrane protein